MLTSFAVLEFRGYLGNFYGSVPYRLVRPFDEIYQFGTNDMGEKSFSSLLVRTIASCTTLLPLT